MNEGFFQRWSRRKAEHAEELNTARQSSGNKEADLHIPYPDENQNGRQEHLSNQAASELPTIDDVQELNRESDYSLFVKKDVDQGVRRAALKKLFSDPHFNEMDGLDIYIDDYTKPSPLTPAMLAGLKHTENIFGQAYEKSEEEDESAGQSSNPDEVREHQIDNALVQAAPMPAHEIKACDIKPQAEAGFAGNSISTTLERGESFSNLPGLQP